MTHAFQGIAVALLIMSWSPAIAQNSAIVEPLPVNFTREAVFAENNLHFVRIPAKAGNVLLIWGGIGDGDADRMQTALTESEPIAEIQLYSPGGSLVESIRIGRQIREQKLMTRIASGQACMSACNFMFLGGVVRLVDPHGEFGVHMFSNKSAEKLLLDLSKPPQSLEEFNERYPAHKLRSQRLRDWLADEAKKSPETPVSEKEFFASPEVMWMRIDERVRDIQQNSAVISTEIALYLIQMRLSLRFLQEFASESAYGIRILDAEQLHRYNIVTD